MGLCPYSVLSLYVIVFYDARIERSMRRSDRCGALNIATFRGRLGDEVSVGLCMVFMEVCVAVVAISRSAVLSGSALVFAGAAWTASVTLFNVGVQLAAPRRWVAGSRTGGQSRSTIADGIALKPAHAV